MYFLFIFKYNPINMFKCWTLISLYFDLSLLLLRRFSAVHYGESHDQTCNSRFHVSKSIKPITCHLNPAQAFNQVSIHLYILNSYPINIYSFVVKISPKPFLKTSLHKLLSFEFNKVQSIILWFIFIYEIAVTTFNP